MLVKLVYTNIFSRYNIFENIILRNIKLHMKQIVSSVGTKSLLRTSSTLLLFWKFPLLATEITSPRNPLPRSIGWVDDRGTCLRCSTELK